jgi:Domain of unknown function (DUF4383)
VADNAYYGRMGFARFYALVFGIAYIGVALLELIMGELRIGDALILQRTTLQNIVHFAIGIVVLGAFFAGEGASRTVTRVIGVVFVILTIWGFAAPDSLGSILGYDGDIPMSYNIVHLVSGLLALFAGFAGTRRAPATA